MSSRIIDLFGGPGGWSEGLRMLGLSEIGIERDEAACATARAAGHERVQADVAALDPMDFAPCSGLIGSPPCQAYSTAGKGAGRRDVAHVLACVAELVAGRDTRAEHAEKCEDARSMLVVEPLRWALALRPAWITLEQVPPVLPLWEVFADALRAIGYSVWTGVLEAERFGVPQTRERAILMAHRDRPVQPPPPTHQRYVPGEPQRHEVTMLGEVLPWVSMAEALGWGMTERPSVSVASGGQKRRGAKPLGAGSGSQRTIDAERDAGAWAYKLARGEGITERHGDRPAQPISQPGRHDPEKSGSQQKNAVRVTVQEAAILQSFRPDYPWHGSKSKQYQQVGNAIPPLLARAILSELIDPASKQKAA